MIAIGLARMPITRAALFAIALIMAGFAWSIFVKTDSISQAFTDKLIAALNARKPVSLISMVAEALPGTAVVCLITPYQNGARYGLPDLQMVDDDRVDVAALDKVGKLLGVLTVKRSRLDLAHTNLGSDCYYGRMQNPILVMDSVTQ